MAAVSLSMAELEAFDHHATRQGRERRFCCPLPACEGKKKDSSHRSLTVNDETGAWYCHRCGERGKLTDFWEERPKFKGHKRARRMVHKAFKPKPDLPEPANDKAWKEQLKILEGLNEPALQYLEGRGISSELAISSGLRYSPSWYGRPAVVFPIRRHSGTLVAAQGRYIDGRSDPKTRTAGPSGSGVFMSPGALEPDPLIITEAPLDALSLASCELPALALIGTKGPVWLPGYAAFRRVLIATDNDAPGEEAAIKLNNILSSFGALCYRLRPSGKDWNEDLATMGSWELAAALERALENVLPERRIIDLYPSDPAELLAFLHSIGVELRRDAGSRIIGYECPETAMPEEELQILLSRYRAELAALLQQRTR